MPKVYQPKKEYHKVSAVLPCSIANNLEGQLEASLGKKPTTRVLHLFFLLIHIIVKRRLALNLSSNEYIRLSSKILAAVLGSNYNNQIISPLIRLNVVEKMNSYSTRHNQCKSYRLAPHYHQVPLTRIEIKIKDYTEKVNKSFDQITQNLLTSFSQPEYRYLRDSLLKLNINYEKAILFCQEALKQQIALKDKVVKSNGKVRILRNRRFNEDIFKKYEESIISIKAGIHRFKVCSNHRIINSCVSLPSLLLPYLYIEGHKGQMHYLDLSQSQVVLLIPLIEKYIKANNLLPISDMYNFIQLAKGKSFYQSIAKMLRANGVKIKEGEEKTRFFQYVQYRDEAKPLVSKDKYRIVFNQLFPDMNKFFQEVKTSNKEFANQMTRVEAKLFINNICRRILKEKGSTFPVYTRHDGLLFVDKDVASIRSITEDELRKYLGFVPHLKHEVWNILSEEQENPNVYYKKNSLKNWETLPTLDNHTEDNHTETRTELNTLIQDWEWDDIAEQVLLTDEERKQKEDESSRQKEKAKEIWDLLINMDFNPKEE